MDASSFALRISWLKFEPKVSNFPVIETDATVSITNATIKVRCIFIFCTNKSLLRAINRDRKNSTSKGSSSLKRTLLSIHP